MVQRKSGHVTLLDVARARILRIHCLHCAQRGSPVAECCPLQHARQIRAMAQQLGYHPDAFARSLRRRRSQTIGVLAYDLSDPFCIPIVQGIQSGRSRQTICPC